MKYLVLAMAAALAAFALIRGGASGVSYEELLARTPPRADARIAYGSAALQFGDLYLPKGRGPYPVIVLIHGGCWLGELPGVEPVAPLAAGPAGGERALCSRAAGFARRGQSRRDRRSRSLSNERRGCLRRPFDHRPPGRASPRCFRGHFARQAAAARRAASDHLRQRGWNRSCAFRPRLCP